jgi:hypothetical protein
MPLDPTLHAGELIATRVKPLHCRPVANTRRSHFFGGETRPHYCIPMLPLKVCKGAGQTPKRWGGDNFAYAKYVSLGAVRVFVDGRTPLAPQNHSDNAEVMSDGHN